MTAKYLNKGHNLDYVNGTGADIAAGDVVKIGDLIGVAGMDILQGELGTVVVHGVFVFPAKEGGEDIEVGAKVYWATDHADSAGSDLLGWCAVAEKTGDKTVAVKLLG